MFVTKKALPRRTFLRGMGATWRCRCWSRWCRRSRRSRRRRPSRRCVSARSTFPTAHDEALDARTPTGAGFEFKPILKPLEPFRDQMNLFGNLSRAGGKSATDHAVSSAGWLTGAVAKQTEAEDIQVGISIDQVLAKQIGQDTPLPSMEVATEDFSGYVGGCVPGYSCAYMNTISWASETASMPMEINPRTAFERMFGRAGTPAERRRADQEDRSILDSVTEEARDLQRKVGAPDRAGSATIWITCERSSGASSGRKRRTRSACSTLDAPLGVPDTFEDHAAMMFDLLAVAYQSDMTRVFSFMMSREASQRTYPELDIPRRTTTCRTTAAMPKTWSGTRRSTCTTPSCSRRSSRSCRRCPRATAPCSTTR